MDLDITFIKMCREVVKCKCDMHEQLNTKKKKKENGQKKCRRKKEMRDSWKQHAKKKIEKRSFRWSFVRRGPDSNRRSRRNKISSLAH